MLITEPEGVNGSSFFHHPCTSEGGINIVGKRKRWYQIAAAIIVAVFTAMLIRGFGSGIDFEGGTKMTMPPALVTAERAEEAFIKATGVKPELVQIIGSGEGQVLEIASEKLTQDEINSVHVALNDAFKPADIQGQRTLDATGDSTVSESWGSPATNRILLTAVVLPGLVFAYIIIHFEHDMAISAILALVVDAVVAMGIYALTGLDVTPVTIIGLLTILSFSLYSTIMVFDRVDKDTAGYRSSTRRSYTELVGLAVNQTIMRSISTTVSTLLPILALMVIAVGMLEVGTLKDLVLVQLIGIIQGTFSLIFLASSLLVSLKSRQREYRKHDEAILSARTKASEGTGSDTDSTAADVTEDSGSRESSASEMKQSTPKRTVTTPKLESNGGKPPSWRPG